MMRFDWVEYWQQMIKLLKLVGVFFMLIGFAFCITWAASIHWTVPIGLLITGLPAINTFIFGNLKTFE